MRDGASSVAAGTPKNGTKAASRSAEVHVGQVEEGPAAADRAHAAACAESVRAIDLALVEAQPARGGWRRPSPCRSAPGRSRRPGASGTAASPRRRRRAPTKCGTSHITGAVAALGERRRRPRRGSAASAAPARRDHSRLRSRMLRPSHSKCSRASARALGLGQLGQAELEVAQRDAAPRGRRAACSRRPRPTPSGASSGERQPVQQPQQGERGAGGHGGAGAGWRVASRAGRCSLSVQPSRPASNGAAAAAACSGRSPTGTARGTAGSAAPWRG